MTMRIFSALFIAAVATSSAGHSQLEELRATHFRQEIEAANRGEQRLSAQELAALVRSRFDLAFGDLLHQEPRTLSNQSLSDLFEAAYLAAFYEVRSERARLVLSLFQEKQRRRIANENDASRTFRSLVASRLFVSASLFRSQHSHLQSESWPEVTDAHGDATRTWYELETTPGRTPRLVRQAAKTSNGLQIVVVAHALCHFTQYAVAAIEKDSVLRELFAQRSRWLVPPDGRLYLDEVQAWNDEHRAMPLVLAHSRDEWLEFDIWETPTFYFLRDGKVLDKVVGWPKEGRLSELRAAVAKAGME